MVIQTKLMKEEFNNSVPHKAFIESPNFPFSEISDASAVEKGPGRPPHWEMVFWWTRKPLISGRAIIAGCFLPEDTNPEIFLRNIGINNKKKTYHSSMPAYRFNGKKLLDPFAGFGSIPLEGLRLGLDTTAIELLPSAYVFLKAILEYPAKYGSKLVDDINHWGGWVIEQLKMDPLINELYDPEVAVYLGSWEVKCPSCGRWTPIVGNWWLARVKGKKGYERLAWMEPKIDRNSVKINVIDLNNELSDYVIEKAEVIGSSVKVGEEEYKVPDSNINARRDTAVCLYCGQPMIYYDPQTQKHYTETKNLPKEVRDRLESYVKYAIKTYNQTLEQNNIPSLAKPRLLVKIKVKDGELEFEPCTDEDQKKLERAEDEVRKLLAQNDPDIPTEELWKYAASGGGALSIWIWGFNKFYKLFNPRQILTLVKLVKLIREAGKKVEEERLKQGWSKDEAYKYAEAVTTYLTIALCKYADYNSIVNRYRADRIRFEDTFAQRGIAMIWNFSDANPLNKVTGITGTLIGVISSVLEGLSYLIYAVSSNSSKVRVVLDDATTLSKLGEENFDAIITDPPYYDDVPYTELSDFYYVWLKRALSDVNDGRLVPRFFPEAFFEKISDGWVEVSTQWQKYALNEVSLNSFRLGPDVKKEDGIKHFQSLLKSSFIIMSSKLKDNGLLVTYYAHTDSDAWKSLLEAGWKAAGLRIINAFPLTTESAQSIVSKGKLSMDTSIIVVWRKGSSGSVDAQNLYQIMVEEVSNRAKNLLDSGITGRNLFISSLAAALSATTQYSKVVSLGEVGVSELIDKYVYPATSLGLAKAFAKKAEISGDIKSSDAMFYLLVKCLIPSGKRKILESTDISLMFIGTSLDIITAIKKWAILREAKEEEEKGSNVAKTKKYFLMEPVSADRYKLEELLEARKIGVSNETKIKCTVDALHVLEYYALIYPADEYKRRIEDLRDKNPLEVNEAFSLAKILAKVLPDEDPEKQLCERILSPLFQTGGE